MIACYTQQVSARPGERVDIHVSTDQERFDLTVARIGAHREVVLEMKGLSGRFQPTPENADRDGCGWEVTHHFEIGATWRQGYYEIALQVASGEVWRHFVCVRRAVNEKPAVASLVLSTNTYQAYNWWGGRNTYCDVGAVLAKKMSFFEGLEHGLGVVSRSRPYAQGILAMPPGAPRLANGATRAFGAMPEMPSRAFNLAHGLGPLDGPAGFVNKWENVFVAWAEARGIDFDYLTDYDLDADASALEGVRTILIVGHSEYWSGPQREALDRFVDEGGNLAIFSGNTCYWKVRWEANGQMACHKHKGFEAEPDAGGAGTHLWSHPAFERPEAELIGLSFLFGGYHRLGMCVARGTGGYTVHDERHWALEGADLFYGDQFPTGMALLGYENDGCRLQYGDDGRMKAVPGLGVPAHLEVIASAPAVLSEDLTRGYPAILAPENLGSSAKLVYGQDNAANRDRLTRGHAVMASFRRGEGEVFNCGATEWAHGLGAGDPYVERITLNVLVRFGVAQPGVAV